MYGSWLGSRSWVAGDPGIRIKHLNLWVAQDASLPVFRSNVDLLEYTINNIDTLGMLHATDRDPRSIRKLSICPDGPGVFRNFSDNMCIKGCQLGAREVRTCAGPHLQSKTGVVLLSNIVHPGRWRCTADKEVLFMNSGSDKALRATAWCWYAYPSTRTRNKTLNGYCCFHSRCGCN